MAHKEACELYIKEQIKDGLSQGKTPYRIGKELNPWLKKIFEANIPARTLTKRAERERNKLATFVANSPARTFTNAMHIATFVISHLERIMPDDPKRQEALEKVSNWINHNLYGGKSNECKNFDNKQSQEI